MSKRTLADYNKPAISVERLDMLADSIFSSTKSPSKLTLIFTGIKLLVAVAYITVRYKLIKKELEIESQRHRNEEIEDNRDEVDTDLDDLLT